MQLKEDLTTWKRFTSFQRLDFTGANIVCGLVESNLIGSGGSEKVYRIFVVNQAGGVKMDEGGKVRVVRCPKCGILLGVLSDIPVYRCGGCNTILQAKRYQSVRTDASSEKSDEEKVRFCDNSESSSGKRDSVLNEMCETDRESDGADVMRKERVMSERMENRMEDSSSRPSSSRGGNKVVDDCNLSREFEEPEPSRYDRGRYRHSSKAPVENWVVTDNLDSRSHELIRRNIIESGEAKALVENVNGGQRLRPVPDQWAVERERPLAFRSGRRAAVEGSRYCPYSDEGPSSHHGFSPYENGEQTKDHNLDGPGRVDALEKDRAELLRKLDELRDQLTRSCDVSDHPKERVPPNRMMVPPNSYDGHDAWFKGGTFPADRSSSQLYAADNPLRRPTYLNNEPHIPSVGRHGMDVQSCYPPVNPLNEVLGYRESFGPQVPMRAPHHTWNQYPQKPSNSYLSSLYVGADPDPSSTYAPYGFYEQPGRTRAGRKQPDWVRRIWIGLSDLRGESSGWSGCSERDLEEQELGCKVGEGN